MYLSKSKWMDKVHGLCGNFDGDDSADTELRKDDGIAGMNSAEFANSWALSSSCPKVDTSDPQSVIPCLVSLAIIAKNG